MKQIIKKIKHAAITACYTLPTSAFASSSGSGLPWEDALTQISDSISGPVLLAISIVMFVVTILMAAFGEWGDGFQKILKVTAFLSLCFGVGSFIDIVFVGGAVM